MKVELLCEYNKMVVFDNLRIFPLVRYIFVNMKCYTGRFVSI